MCMTLEITKNMLNKRKLNNDSYELIKKNAQHSIYIYIIIQNQYLNGPIQ